MLTEEEQTDLTQAMRPVRWLVKAAAVCVVSLFIFPFLGLLILIPVGLVLPVLGYRLHAMNHRRIAQGKSSISVGRSGGTADFNHKVNQGGAIFYMVLGAVIALLTITAPLRW